MAADVGNGTIVQLITMLKEVVIVKILIAEDELDLLALLKDNLTREGHSVITADNGEDAYCIFEQQPVDLCILDVMMPGIDGFRLVQKIRTKSEVPVIFLTARSDEMDRVFGLTAGGDDYLVKPFSMAELKARIQVQIRHIQKAKTDSNNILLCGELRLYLDEAVCYKKDTIIPLGAKEFLLLRLFMENQGRVFTKKQLYHGVWDDEFLYDDNTVMVHLSRLRNKLEENPKTPEYLITIRGIGYKINKIPPFFYAGEFDES